jgi:hypothetical protein
MLNFIQILTALGGMLIQCHTIANSLGVLWNQKPCAKNVFFMISMFLYAVTFVPLLIKASLLDISEHHRMLSSIFELVYGCSTLIYIVLAQVRFQSIKELVWYPSFLDVLFMFNTGFMWVVFSFGLNVLMPVMTSNFLDVYEQWRRVWMIYFVAVENLLIFTFLYNIFYRINNITNIVVQTLKSVFQWCVWSAGASVISIGFIILSGQNVGEYRDLLFNIGYCISPCIFINTAMLMESIEEARQLVASQDSWSDSGHSGYSDTAKFFKKNSRRVTGSNIFAQKQSGGHTVMVSVKEASSSPAMEYQKTNIQSLVSVQTQEPSLSIQSLLPAGNRPGFYSKFLADSE